eukprot:scaffold22.g6145.t1
MSGSDRSSSSDRAGRQEKAKLVSRVQRLFQPIAAKRVSSQAERHPFDVEDHISEKREWTKRYTSATGGGPGRPLYLERLFEHFAIVGLPPTTNVRAVTADIRLAQRLARQGGAGAMRVTADAPREAGIKARAGVESVELIGQYAGVRGQAMPAEVLHAYPREGLTLDLEQSLAAFCFPHGVRAELLERTPSMSSLNEVIYSQPYATADDHSFVFTMKVLQTILGLERLDRITTLAAECVEGFPAAPSTAAPSSVAPSSSRATTASASGDAPAASGATVAGGGAAEGEGEKGAEDEERRRLVRERTASVTSRPQAPSPGDAAPAAEQQQQRQQQGRPGQQQQQQQGGPPAPAGAAAAAVEGGAATPDGQRQPGTGGGGGSIAATPYFTPPSLPAAAQPSPYSLLAAQQQGAQGHAAAAEGGEQRRAPAAEAEPGGRPPPSGLERMNSIKRALAGSLAQAGAGEEEGQQQEGGGAPLANGHAIQQPESVAVTANGVAPAALTEEGSGATGTRPSSGSSEGRAWAAARSSDEAASEADSFVTAASSAAAGQQQQQQPAHVRSVSGTSLGGFASPAGSRPGTSGGGGGGEGGGGGAAAAAAGRPPVPHHRSLSRVEVLTTTTTTAGSRCTSDGEGGGAGGAAAAFGRGDTPPRPDLLSCTPLGRAHSRPRTRHGRAPPGGDGGATPASSAGGSPARRAAAAARGGEQPGGAAAAANPAAGAGQAEQEEAAEDPAREVPDPGLQSIAFERPDLAEAARELGLRPDAACLPDIDAAQMVVFCPNAGLLCGCVLSLVPMLLPFSWQCLLLPVLPAAPASRLDLLEAPVPFVLGALYKTAEVRARCGGLIRVNVYKDRIKNAGGLPPLPQAAALAEALAGTYAELRRAGAGVWGGLGRGRVRCDERAAAAAAVCWKISSGRAAATRPVHMVSDAQQVLAECFLSTLQKYLRSLVADLKAHCITDVSASMERVSVLMKDSFVESFPPRDKPFMRQFAETQMFAVYCDAVLG